MKINIHCACDVSFEVNKCFLIICEHLKFSHFSKS